VAIFSMSIGQVKRSKGHSAPAAAAYRAGERLWDERRGITHDYRNRQGVEHKEILLPGDAPDWARGLDRETLWNLAEARERRKDSQVARDLRITIPRELDPPERIRVVRDFVQRSYVDRGMIADICWHNKTASDGLQQPHAHVLLTMRHLTSEGFGLKSRHDWVPDPSGRTHADGRPVMVESNAESWNSIGYFEQTREDWEKTANEALARAGSDQRIDRRSLLERGLARLPEPALRLAYYLRDLRGVMKERFGQFQYARHYRAVEERAKAALEKPAGELPAGRTERFIGWFERQLARLDPAPPEREQTHNPPLQERSHDR
jgi:ATP-dependent exoDNAse (exonuclease V) alpha subunit